MCIVSVVTEVPPVIPPGPGWWVWKAADCSSHTGAGECRKSRDGWGEPKAGGIAWKNSHAHTSAQQRPHQGKERSLYLNTHFLFNLCKYIYTFFYFKSIFLFLLQVKQSLLFPVEVMTVLWLLKNPGSLRNLWSLLVAMRRKRRMKRVSETNLRLPAISFFLRWPCICNVRKSLKWGLWISESVLKNLLIQIYYIHFIISDSLVIYLVFGAQISNKHVIREDQYYRIY